MEHSERDGVLAASGFAADLVRHPQVAEGWADQSACGGMTVGGLACHLGSQVDLMVGLLQAGQSDLAPIPLTEHYARVAVSSGPDDEANVGIREGSYDLARSGPDALATLVDARLQTLPSVLGVAPELAGSPGSRERSGPSPATGRGSARPQRAPAGVAAF